MTTAREAIIISYRPTSSEQCLFILEAITEGVVQANLVEIETAYGGFEGFAVEGIRYENPVIDTRHGQKIGTISEVLEKGTATCVEVAAASAAVIRHTGREADVEFVPQMDTYGKPMPWRYHAVVKLPDGTFVDPTEEIKEGPVVGACCSSCSVGNECEADC